MPIKHVNLRAITSGGVLAGCLAISGGTFPAEAQDRPNPNGVALVGVVLEEGSDRPLAGASVAIVGEELATESAADGEFLFEAVPVGDLTVRVSLEGYASLVEPLPALGEASTYLQLRLLPLTVAVEGIIATVPGVFRRGATAETLVPAADADARSVADLLEGAAAGLSLNRNMGSAAGGARVQLRGVNSIAVGNEPIFYVNGARISTQAGEMHVLETIPASWVRQIRVLRGPSAQYPDAFNGVVLIETDPGGSGG